MLGNALHESRFDCGSGRNKVTEITPLVDVERLPQKSLLPDEC